MFRFGEMYERLKDIAVNFYVAGLDAPEGESKRRPDDIHAFAVMCHKMLEISTILCYNGLKREVKL